MPAARAVSAIWRLFTSGQEQFFTFRTRLLVQPARTTLVINYFCAETITLKMENTVSPSLSTRSQLHFSPHLTQTPMVQIQWLNFIAVIYCKGLKKGKR
jgi:hypothetical protein